MRESLHKFAGLAWHAIGSASDKFSALAGMGLIAAGAALVYLPAGLIAGGILLILASIDSRL